MGKKKSLTKKIDFIDSQLRFFRNALLAILSALVWTIYAIMEHKAGKEIFVLSGIGFIVMIYIYIKIKSLETEQLEYIDELEKE